MKMARGVIAARILPPLERRTTHALVGIWQDAPAMGSGGAARNAQG